MSRKIEDKIERASEARRRAWSIGDPVAVAKETEKLERLYGELRLARARQRDGKRDQIVRTARVERELEKLMG